jgi:hypothetical protein
MPVSRSRLAAVVGDGGARSPEGRELEGGEGEVRLLAVRLTEHRELGELLRFLDAAGQQEATDLIDVGASVGVVPVGWDRAATPSPR